MKVAIVQEFVPTYREAFFSGLNEALGGQLTLFVNHPNSSLACKQIVFSNNVFFGGITHGILDLSVFDHYDAVVLSYDMRWTLLYRALLRRRTYKLFLFGHGMGRRSSLAKLKASIIRLSQGFIAYEEPGADFFAERGVQQSKLAFMGNTVAVEDHHLSKKSRDYFIYMGRLQERKGLDDLIRAYAKLSDAYKSRAGLLFMGDGDLRGDLEALAVSLGVDEQCQFVPGSYDPLVVRSYLTRAIAYVSPGHVGLGVLHAFAYGVPVITRRDVFHGPEVCNVRDGDNGILVGAGDSQLKDAMSTYLNYPELHKAHCQSAYESYSSNRTMQKMIQRFHDALVLFSGESHSGR